MLKNAGAAVLTLATIGLVAACGSGNSKGPSSAAPLASASTASTAATQAPQTTPPTIVTATTTSALSPAQVVTTIVNQVPGQVFPFGGGTLVNPAGDFGVLVASVEPYTPAKLLEPAPPGHRAVTFEVLVDNGSGTALPLEGSSLLVEVNVDGVDQLEVDDGTNPEQTVPPKTPQFVDYHFFVPDDAVEATLTATFDVLARVVFQGALPNP